MNNKQMEYLVDQWEDRQLGLLVLPEEGSSWLGVIMADEDLHKLNDLAQFLLQDQGVQDAVQEMAKVLLRHICQQMRYYSLKAILLCGFAEKYEDCLIFWDQYFLA